MGLVIGSGHVTGAELTQACVEMVTSPDWRSGFDEIWDLSPSGEVDISPDDLDGLVATTHEYASRIGVNRCVFVHTRESVEPALRLFEWLTGDLLRVYHTARSLAEALDWLGLPADALAGLARRR